MEAGPTPEALEKFAELPGGIQPRVNETIPVRRTEAGSRGDGNSRHIRKCWRPASGIREAASGPIGHC